MIPPYDAVIQNVFGYCIKTRRGGSVHPPRTFFNRRTRLNDIGRVGDTHDQPRIFSIDQYAHSCIEES